MHSERRWKGSRPRSYLCSRKDPNRSKAPKTVLWNNRQTTVTRSGTQNCLVSDFTVRALIQCAYRTTGPSFSASMFQFQSGPSRHRSRCLSIGHFPVQRKRSARTNLLRCTKLLWLYPDRMPVPLSVCFDICSTQSGAEISGAANFPHNGIGLSVLCYFYDPSIFTLATRACSFNIVSAFWPCKCTQRQKERHDNCRQNESSYHGNPVSNDDAINFPDPLSRVRITWFCGRVRKSCPGAGTLSVT